MRKLRERVAMALFADYTEFLPGAIRTGHFDREADVALAALGLADLDAAAERSIDAWAHDYANDDWRALSAEGQLAVARRVLEAALTPEKP